MTTLTDAVEYPWARDFDYAWHRRPEGDEWRTFKVGVYDGPQCNTVCGKAINSAHVSDSRPDVSEPGREHETLCPACLIADAPDAHAQEAVTATG